MEELVVPVPVLRIVAPRALFNVPEVTFKMPVPVPPPLPGFVSNSITPLLVNPLATVNVVEELLAPESIWSVPVLVRPPLMLLVVEPTTVSVPEFTILTLEAIVSAASVNAAPAPIVRFLPLTAA